MNTIDQAAQMLLKAFNDHQPIESLPDEIKPSNVEEGYAVQQAGHRLSGVRLGPWKVGATSAMGQKFLGIDAPFVGRPHLNRVLTDGADISLSEWFVGPAGIEVEIGCIPLSDLTEVPDDPLELSSLVDVVGCFELVNSRFTDLVRPGASSLIADNAVSSVIVRGSSLGLDVQQIRALDQLVVALDIDGTEQVAATGASALGHPLNVLQFVARKAIEWGTPIAAGELVITGTCTGLVPPVAGMSIVGRFGDSQIAATFRP
jgi:2-keto-4-pentenoate hydratase